MAKKIKEVCGETVTLTLKPGMTRDEVFHIYQRACSVTHIQYKEEETYGKGTHIHIDVKGDLHIDKGDLHIQNYKEK